jgi:hypothetical protein
MYIVNVGFCTMYILNKWIQLQYGGKCYSNLRAFHVNQPSNTSGNPCMQRTDGFQVWHISSGRKVTSNLEHPLSRS